MAPTGKPNITRGIEIDVVTFDEDGGIEHYRISPTSRGRDDAAGFDAGPGGPV